MTFAADRSVTEYKIRRATVSDAQAVAMCVEAAYAPWVSVIGMRPGPMNQDYRLMFSLALVFVAVGEVGLDGVLVLRVEDEGFLLDNVAVHPRAQGKGLGSRLMALAEHKAVVQRFTSIYLYTHARTHGCEYCAVYGAWLC